jgi:hypothetical protein
MAPDEHGFFAGLGTPASLAAHGLLGAFFTATSMIGFMAGAGTVVRNSIIPLHGAELDFRVEQGRRTLPIPLHLPAFPSSLLTPFPLTLLWDTSSAGGWICGKLFYTLKHHL